MVAVGSLWLRQELKTRSRWAVLSSIPHSPTRRQGEKVFLRSEWVRTVDKLTFACGTRTISITKIEIKRLPFNLEWFHVENLQDSSPFPILVNHFILIFGCTSSSWRVWGCLQCIQGVLHGRGMRGEGLARPRNCLYFPLNFLPWPHVNKQHLGHFVLNCLQYSYGDKVQLSEVLVKN